MLLCFASFTKKLCLKVERTSIVREVKRCSQKTVDSNNKNKQDGIENNVNEPIARGIKQIHIRAEGTIVYMKLVSVDTGYIENWKANGSET